MNIIKIVITGAVLLFLITLVYMLFNAAVSLDHSRSQNESLKKKCRQLSVLASEGLHGKSVKDVLAKAGAAAIVKQDGDQLWIDDVVLRIEDNKVVEVVISETCE